MRATKDTTLKLRVSDEELAAIDAARGLATRSAYLRSLIPSDDLTEQGRRLASEREDLIAAGVDPAELHVPLPHTHHWHRDPDATRLDTCACGLTRPHQAGTR